MKLRSRKNEPAFDVARKHFNRRAYVAELEALESLDFPKKVDIETTNACNLKCPMCARTTAMTRDVGDMTFETFRRIADELANYEIDWVSLHVFGEPLMHPEIFEFISYIKQFDRIKAVGLSTNVTVLDERRARGLVESKLDVVNLALDAATSDAYASTRGANFDHVVGNVTRFLELRKAVDSSITVQISLIPMILNQGDVEAFQAQWAPYVGDGVTVQLKPFGDFAGQVPDFGLEDNTGESVVPVQFVTRKGQLAAPPRLPCRMVWDSVAIHSRGDVVACCFDADGQLHLGNVADQTIAEIWNAEPHRLLRAAHASGDLDAYPLCGECALSREPAWTS